MNTLINIPNIYKIDNPIITSVNNMFIKTIKTSIKSL